MTKNETQESTPKPITAEYFREKTGKDPVNDDLDRCNCVEVGMLGHYFCGWCSKCDLPRFMCGHMKRTPCKKVYKTATVQSDGGNIR